jgi:hypothetical protein
MKRYYRFKNYIVIIKGHDEIVKKKERVWEILWTSTRARKNYCRGREIIVKYHTEDPVSGWSAAGLMEIARDPKCLRKR